MQFHISQNTINQANTYRVASNIHLNKNQRKTNKKPKPKQKQPAQPTNLCHPSFQLLEDEFTRMICLEFATVSSPPLNPSHLFLMKRFHFTANRWLVNFSWPEDSKQHKYKGSKPEDARGGKGGCAWLRRGWSGQSFFSSHKLSSHSVHTSSLSPAKNLPLCACHDRWLRFSLRKSGHPMFATPPHLVSSVNLISMQFTHLFRLLTKMLNKTQLE